MVSFVGTVFLFGCSEIASEKCTKLLNMLIYVINTYGLDLRETFYSQWIPGENVEAREGANVQMKELSIKCGCLELWE